ncbi:MAG: NDP-sugar synthase [Nitrososphaerales archaeon]
MSTTDISELRVIIPVGGEAKRLRPLTAESSKAVVRIFNRPLVEYAMVELARQGVRNFIFGAKGYVNYRSLFDYFGEGMGFSYQYRVRPRVHIKYQPRIDDVGSADSVRILTDYYNIQKTFLVVQGDNLFELDLADLMYFQKRTNAFMVVVLTPVDEVEAYGIADMDEMRRIRRFVEKPARGEAPSKMANTGIYLISPEIAKVFKEPEVQQMIKVRKRLDFGLDLIPYLIDRYPVYGYYMQGDWLDVGTPRGYLKAVTNLLNKKERPRLYLGDPVTQLTNVWIQGRSPESISRKEQIVQNALSGRIRLEGSAFIGRHCQIEEGSIIKDSCIDNFCILGRDVAIERSAIMDRTVIEDGASIQDSIIGRHVRVASSLKRPTWITGLSVIGDDVDIGEGATLVSTRVNPHKTIPEGADIQGQFLE